MFCKRVVSTIALMRHVIPESKAYLDDAGNWVPCGALKEWGIMVDFDTINKSDRK